MHIDSASDQGSSCHGDGQEALTRTHARTIGRTTQFHTQGDDTHSDRITLDWRQIVPVDRSLTFVDCCACAVCVGLFLILVLQRHWSSGPGDNWVSYTLMACVVLNCYAGLAYKIWRGRQAVFNRVEFPEPEPEPADEGGAPAGVQGGVAASAAGVSSESGSGSGSIAAPGPVGANGFSRLPSSQAQVDSAV